MDSLYIVVKFVDDLDLYSEVDINNKIVYFAIKDYWYNIISNELGKLSQKRPGIKYGFKFRYLKQECINNNYLPNEGNSKLEKIVLYFFESKWSYLFYRFWNSTSWKFKAAIILISIVGCYVSYKSIYCLITQKIKRNA